MKRDRWLPWVQNADALLVDGGDAIFLRHWLQESGLADVLPDLAETVWVGVSAGSMVMTPRIGEAFVSWQPEGETDQALGLVDFSIFPHLNHPEVADNDMAHAERWAADIGGPAYAIDDQSAIVVADGDVRIVTEGAWRAFPE